jgi:ABC-type transporter Mla maintaining outer membrane lipid asymmetry permease subunit MlaE
MGIKLGEATKKFRNRNFLIYFTLFALSGILAIDGYYCFLSMGAEAVPGGREFTAPLGIGPALGVNCIYILFAGGGGAVFSASIWRADQRKSADPEMATGVLVLIPLVCIAVILYSLGTYFAGGMTITDVAFLSIIAGGFIGLAVPKFRAAMAEL